MNESVGGIVAAWFAAGSDDARALWSIVALLAVLGVGLAMLAVALVRWTRPDPELLAPLEVMGNRKWRRSDPVWQRRQLDAVRPPDAQPLTSAPATPVPLEGFEQGPAAGGFDDLTDIGSGVDHDLAELPGGVVYDTDPTPPSGEVPVVVLDAEAIDVPLAQLGIDWGAPSLEDLAIASDEPVVHAAADEPDTSGDLDESDRLDFVADSEPSIDAGDGSGVVGDATASASAPLDDAADEAVELDDLVADDDETRVVERPADDEPVELSGDPMPLATTDEPVEQSGDGFSGPGGERPDERRG